MLNRRVDVVYFSMLLVAVLIGIYASNQAPEEASDVDLAEFDTPELALEAPFEFPYAIPSFENRRAPLLRISDNVEWMLVEVRSALLTSAKPVAVVPGIGNNEVEDPRQLASAAD